MIVTFTSSYWYALKSYLGIVALRSATSICAASNLFENLNIFLTRLFVSSPNMQVNFLNMLYGLSMYNLQLLLGICRKLLLYPY